MNMAQRPKLFGEKPLILTDVLELSVY